MKLTKLSRKTSKPSPPPLQGALGKKLREYRKQLRSLGKRKG